MQQGAIQLGSPVVQELELAQRARDGFAKRFVERVQGQPVEPGRRAGLQQVQRGLARLLLGRRMLVEGLSVGVDELACENEGSMGSEADGRGTV